MGKSRVEEDKLPMASKLLEAAARLKTALVLPVDTPALGRREANERHRFRLPEHLGIPNIGPRSMLAGRS